MPAGIQVFNDSGTIQIDERFANLALRDTGEINMADFDGVTADITLTADKPVLALMIVSGSGYISRPGTIYNGDGTWHFFFKCSDDPSTVFRWFLFDLPQYADASGDTGLEVLDDSGNLTFDSRLKYMRVIDFQRGTSIGSGITYTYDSGRKIAIVPIQWWFRYDYSETIEDEVPPNPPIYHYTYEFYHGAFHWNDINEVLLEERIYQTITGDSIGSSPTYSGPWVIEEFIFMAIDVTDYF